MASRGCIRVERLQQTTFAEHWRVVFRRQYFTSRTALDRSLRGFMEFYNFERPHHGYRSVGGPRRRSFTARSRRPVDFTLHSGAANVSTPTRVWTVQTTVTCLDRT